MLETPENKPEPSSEEVSPVVAILSVSVESGDDSYSADFFIRHPEPAVKPERRDCGPEVEKLEGLMAEFETKHSLAELNAITELSPDLVLLFKHADELESPEKVENTARCYELNNPSYVEVYRTKIAGLRAIILSPDEAKKLEIRRAAIKDEKTITVLIELIKKETNVSKEQLEELQVKRKRISNAVGSINGGEVVHNR